MINGAITPIIYTWPHKCVTGVITRISGVITPFITGRGPPCRERMNSWWLSSGICQWKTTAISSIRRGARCHHPAMGQPNTNCKLLKWIASQSKYRNWQNTLVFSQLQIINMHVNIYYNTLTWSSLILIQKQHSPMRVTVRCPVHGNPFKFFNSTGPFWSCMSFLLALLAPPLHWPVSPWATFHHSALEIAPWFRRIRSPSCVVMAKIRPSLNIANVWNPTKKY